MSWLIKWNGTELDSDDLTIADLGRVEKESDTPWSVANPFREVVVARAFLACAMRRSGMPDDEVTTALDGLTLRTMKAAFQWVDDDESGGEADEADPSDRPPNPTTPGS